MAFGLRGSATGYARLAGCFALRGGAPESARQGFFAVRSSALGSARRRGSLP